MRLLLFLLSLAWTTASGLAQSAPASSPRALGPDDCVRLGLQHNRQLEAARARAAEADAGVREARSMRLPVVSGLGTYQRLSPNIPDFAIDLGALAPPGAAGVFEVPAILDRYTLRVSLSQPLFTGFQVRSGIRAARHQAAAVQQSVAAAEADLAFRIREAYWAVGEALAVQTAAATSLAHVEALAEDVLHLRDQGMALEADVLAVETRRAEVALAQLEAEHALRLARLALNDLMGLPLETEVVPEPLPDVFPSAGDPDALAELALQRRPEPAALAREIRAREAEVRALSGAGWPQLSLVGAYDYARPNPYVFPLEDAFNGTWEAGVRLSLDLFSGGRTNARARRARARVAEARVRWADARAAVRLEVMRAVLAVERAEAAAAVTEQGLAAAEERYRVERARFREGLAQTADVLDADAALRTAEQRRAAARAARAVADAGLRRTTGEPPAPERARP